MTNFSSLGGPWLLVFDNVKKTEDIIDYLPTFGNGAIIVTTRDRNIAVRLSPVRIDMEGFNVVEAESLLRLIVPQHQSSTLAAEVSEELGGLPLAITHVSHFVRLSGCSLDQLLSHLKTHTNRLFSNMSCASCIPYPLTLEKCCEASLSSLSEHTLYLFGVLVFFQVDEIPKTLLNRGCSQVFRLERFTDELELDVAIGSLEGSGLIDWTQNPAMQAFRIQRVLKLYTLGCPNTQPRHSKMFSDAVTLLSQVFPSRSPDGGTMFEQWAECVTWLPHVLSLKEAFPRVSKDELDITTGSKYLELICNCAYYMWECSTEGTEEVALHALDLCARGLECNQGSIIADVFTLLGSLELQGFHSRSRCLHQFQHVLDMRLSSLATVRGHTHTRRLQLANAYNNKGVALLVQGEHGQALALFQKSLDLKLELGNQETMPYEFGLSFFNISQVQAAQGLLNEALQNAEEALRLVEGNNGPDDHRSNQIRCTLANLLSLCDRMNEGLELHTRTLEIRSRVLSPRSNDIGVSYSGLSRVYHGMGRLDEALYYSFRLLLKRHANYS